MSESTYVKPAKFRLFAMMVLQFFIWGAWLPLIFGYLPSLGFTAAQQSWILNAFPIAAIVGMFFSNQFADRNFAAEKFLAVSHIIGGLAMLGLAFVKSSPEALDLVKNDPKLAWNSLAPFWPFLGLMLVHCLLYVPTISITNSIAFANMKDAKEEFGIVRMGGTIGWILAAWPFTFILVNWDAVKAANPQSSVEWLGAVLQNGLKGEALKQATTWTFVVAGIASLALAGLSFALPHTPPKKKSEGSEDSLAWLEAMKLLKHPFILVLWLVTFVDSFVHNSYFNWTGAFLGASPEAGGVGIPGNWIMPVMSVGQIAEILTMFVLGATLKKLGWRWTMVVGVLGHTLRFAVYAFLPEHRELIILVQVVHGICYAFFFATVYIFVDAYFPKDARSSAQGLFNVMILGVGAMLANSICPYLQQNVFTQPDGAVNFRSMFLIPCGAALAAAVALALFFKPPAEADVNAAQAGH